jgi:thiaminase
MVVCASRPDATGNSTSPILSPPACRGYPARTRFRRYLTQDYLFLIHFARSYALLVSKLRTLPEMRAAAASMNAILNELPLHVGYCASGAG